MPAYQFGERNDLLQSSRNNHHPVKYPTKRKPILQGQLEWAWGHHRRPQMPRFRIARNLSILIATCQVL
jgi:hypothetical protein